VNASCCSEEPAPPPAASLPALSASTPNTTASTAHTIRLRVRLRCGRTHRRPTAASPTCHNTSMANPTVTAHSNTRPPGWAANVANAPPLSALAPPAPNVTRAAR
jgi:hypothetical protein